MFSRAHCQSVVQTIKLRIARNILRSGGAVCIDVLASTSPKRSRKYQTSDASLFFFLLAGCIIYPCSREHIRSRWSADDGEIKNRVYIHCTTSSNHSLYCLQVDAAQLGIRLDLYAFVSKEQLPGPPCSSSSSLLERLESQNSFVQD
jgi:hypothetical protein